MRRQKGFSLIETLSVVGIVMVVMTTGMPTMVTAIANSRMRASMTSLSSVFQACRMKAVKENRIMTTYTSTAPSGITAYVKRASEPNQLRSTDLQVQLQAPVVQVTAPSGPGAPSALDATTLGFTPQTGNASFNTRGLPCTYSSGNCTSSGFAYYFYDTRPGGQRAWSAVSISPAGRVKRWFWGGSSWGE